MEGSSWTLDRKLDPGEAEALALACKVDASLILMDERLGRRAAAKLGLPVTGTLGAIVEAARRGLVDFETALAALKNTTNFRVGESVIEAARKRLASGKSQEEP